jgi:4-hydroxy-tetrahydrodipicolinate synthase
MGAFSTDSLTGVLPPLVTPFREGDEEIDEPALRQEIRYMVDEAKVKGIVVGGSTGEGQTLTTDEVRQLVGVTVDEVAGRVPVVAGIIVDSTRQAVERVKVLSDLDVTALQVTPVHYLWRPSDEMMQHHFATIAAASSFPLFIYNVVSWSYLSPRLLTKIITEVDGVVGVKQSAADLRSLADVLLFLDGRGLVFSAMDALLYPSFVLKPTGVIAGVLPTAPKLCVQLWDAVERGDHVTALGLHEKLLPIWQAIEGDNMCANIKTTMDMQNRAHSVCRSPMTPTSAAQKAAIRDALVNAELIAG